ncbi:MAG: redoxin domain-containing protein, partial [Maricaulaceae bacterium]
AAADYVDDFELTDHRGASHSLYYFSDAPAVVLMAVAAEDAVSKEAAARLQAVADAYADQGVVFYLMTSVPADTRADMIAEMSAIGVDLPVLMDEHQLIGESLGVARTGDVFLVSPSQGWEVAYQGPVGSDDEAGLADALAAVLAGEAVAVSSIDNAAGTPIAFPERERTAEHADISYSDTIAPMLMDNCVACHSPGGIGPFAMTSYDMVRGYAPMIREVVRTRRMPPYHADPHVGEFADARRLDPEEITTLVHWIEAGAPRGQGDDPLIEGVTEAPEWPLGEPDMVVELPPFDVPASGVVEYWNPVIENPLTEAKWLRASTVNVGSRETVHHVLSPVGGYAVGAESTIAPENTGTLLEPGQPWRFQVHYTPYGRAVTDVTRVGLYFYDEAPELVNHNSVIADFTIEIPPGAERHEEIAYMEFPADAELISAFPHAHYRGRSSSVTLRRPDGSEELILSLPNYDFNWQRAYNFAEPIQVPAGSKLIARYEYDNSPRNPANPDPEATITWGDQSFEEMLYTAIRYRWIGETSENMDEFANLMNGRDLFGLLDDNIDDRLVEAELRGAMAARFRTVFSTLDANADGAIDREEFAAAESLGGGFRGRRRPDGTGDE